MLPSDDASYLESRTLLILMAAATLALAWILLPFYGTILWAAVISVLFAPLYGWLLRRTGRRHTLSALLTLLAVLLIVVLPLGFITASLANEAAAVVQRVQSGEWDIGHYLRGLYAALPDWLANLLARAGLPSFEALQRRLSTTLAQGSQFFATQALNIGQNTFEFIVALFITLYLAFFFVRDGYALARTIGRALPLPARHKRDLFDKFTTVIRATVKGNLLVAAAQGALGGLAFWFLDVNGALLWAVMMTFLSLLPAVGAGLVWVPVALYFFASGQVWQGVALVAWGTLVIGLVDNLLRPVLVGKDTRMPDYVVMITTVGGIAVFGINGFVLGPVIAAMFIAVWDIHIRTRPEGTGA